MSKTQTISRKDLQVLYDKVACNSWETRIKEILNEQLSNDEIVANEEEIYKAYKEADADKKKMIKKYFTIVMLKDVTEGIETLKDVYDRLGVDRDDVIPFKKPKNKSQLSSNAKVDIEHITKLINGDWIPDFTDRDQPKYYLYFERRAEGWAVFFNVYYRYLALGGFGSYFRSSEFALWAGNKFLNVFIDFLPL